jgi:hypothetical protein
MEYFISVLVCDPPYGINLSLSLKMDYQTQAPNSPPARPPRLALEESSNSCAEDIVSLPTPENFLDFLKVED